MVSWSTSSTTLPIAPAAQDNKIAIVYNDWPILGDVSVYAAKSALASRWQGQYLMAHDALINGPRLAQNTQVDAVLQRAGVNIDVLNSDRTWKTRLASPADRRSI